MQKAEADRKARVIYRVEPEYTPDAREKKIEGTVVLTLTVDHDGLPQNIKVKQSLYPSLDQSAIEAASKMRFEPAMKDGQPVSQAISASKCISDGLESLLETGNPRNVRKRARKGSQVSGATLKCGERKEEQERRQDDQRPVSQAELVPRAQPFRWIERSRSPPARFPARSSPAASGRDGDKLFYHVVIIGGDGDKTTTTYVWVSAIDGQILKTEKEERKDDEVSIERSGQLPISGGVLNGSAISMPHRPYPPIARAAHASGAVSVEITIDETGNVIAAHAVSGHPLLQAAAVTAARQASFRPTKLNGEPVKVTGVLVYNFVAQ